jgi:hypothetical protein
VTLHRATDRNKNNQPGLTASELRQLREQLGPRVAKVCEVALRQGETTHAAIAKKAGVSVPTVKRHLQKLREGGWIKWETAQHTTRYQAPTAVNGPQSGRSNDLPGDQSRGCVGAVSSCLREEEHQPVHERSSLQSSLQSKKQRHHRVSKGRSRPIGIFDPQVVTWVVELFGHNVLAVHGGDNIPLWRIKRWVPSAFDLLATDGRPLEQVAEVIAWVFARCGGYLPFVPYQHGHLSYSPDARKVTRIAQIRENYDDILKAMRPWKTTSLAQLAENYDEDRQPPATRASRTAKINYGKPFTDEAMEAQVGQLVECFLALRVLPADHRNLDYWRWGWAKSFRIMLHHDGRSFDDIAEAIEALRLLQQAGCHRYIGISRHYNAIRLRWEFDQVLDDISRLRSSLANRPAPVPPPPKPPDPRFGHVHRDGKVKVFVSGVFRDGKFKRFASGEADRLFDTAEEAIAAWEQAGKAEPADRPANELLLADPAPAAGADQGWVGVHPADRRTYVIEPFDPSPKPTQASTGWDDSPWEVRRRRIIAHRSKEPVKREETFTAAQAPEQCLRFDQMDWQQLKLQHHQRYLAERRRQPVADIADAVAKLEALIRGRAGS